MRAALSLLAPFLSLPILVLLGSALALWHTQRVGRLVKPQDGRRNLLVASLVGISLNFTLAVLLPELEYVFATAGILTLGSVTCLIWAWPTGSWIKFKMRWPWGLLIAFILLVYACPILLQPLQEWDARSIWFFHAKMIYFNTGLNVHGEWANPVIAFSQVDYPKLLPLLAGQFTSLAGYWNEYLPKAAMLVLLMPVVLGIATLGERFDLGFVYLLFAFLLSPGILLWNGYADGYLAAYGGMALLFLARWLEAHDPVDCTVGILFVGLAVNLKNEGALLAISVAGALLIYKLAIPACWRVSDLRRIDRSGWTLMSIPLVGSAAWLIRKRQWGLVNELQLGGDSLSYFQRHLDEGGLWMIVQAMLVQGYLAAAATLLLLTVWLALRVRLHMQFWIWFPAFVAAIYTGGLCAVYMATPRDLGWHLSTSADRTMLLVTIGVFASTYLILQRILTAQDTDYI